MYARAAILVVAALAMAGLSGCYESTSVTVVEPGVYKGAKDPLVEKQRSPEQQQRLRERFALGQTER